MDDLIIRVGKAEAGRLQVALEGDLDMPATFRLESELERHLGSEEVSRLELDCAGVEFLDSAGLGTLLSTRQRAQELGVELAVTNPSDVVQRVLEMTGTTLLRGA